MQPTTHPNESAVFWAAAEYAVKLLLEGDKLQQACMTIPAEKCVLKAAALLMLGMSTIQKQGLPEEIQDLVRQFRESENPFEQMEILKKVSEI